MTTSNSSAVWEGGLRAGRGRFTAGSGAFGGNYSFATRFESAKGTNPEELIAAAHAACYAMALNGTLGRKNASATRTLVTATVTADKGDAGIKLTTSRLKVVAEGLKGIEKSQFADVAREAEGKCPISNALRGNLQIEVDAEAR